MFKLDKIIPEKRSPAHDCFNEDSAVKMSYIALKVLYAQMLFAPATLFSYDWFNLFILDQWPMKSLYVIYCTGMAGFAAIAL